MDGKIPRDQNKSVTLKGQMAFLAPFLFRGNKTKWLLIFLSSIMILVKNEPMSVFQILENSLTQTVYPNYF